MEAGVPEGRQRHKKALWEEEKKELERKIQRLEARLNNKSKTRELEKELLVLSIREDEQLKFQVQALETRLESKDKKIDLLKDKVDGSEELLAEYSKTIELLTREVHTRRDRLYAQEQQMEELQTRCVGLGSDLKEKSSQLEALLAEYRGGSVWQEYRQIIERQASEIKELKSTAEAQENRIKDAQESAIRLQKAARYETTEDDDIRLLLETEVLEKVRTWARTWTADKIDMNGVEYDSADLLKAVQEVADVHQGNLKRQLRSLQPRIIVTALLSQFLRGNVFEQPFYQLGSGSGISDMMNRLYTTFIQEKESEAHAWRSSTLQLVGKARTSEASELRKFLESSGNEQAKGLASKFLDGPARYFLSSIGSPQSGERKEKLVELIRSSSDFSLRLWKQRVALELRGFRYYQNRPFKHNSPIMVAHRSHRIEDHDARRDGEKVKMVVQPGFFARGNEHGERYDDQEKVWAEAVVMLP